MSASSASSSKALLIFLSIAHFFVDLACIFLAVVYFPAEDWVFYVLIYNFCAFALQLPIGLLADLCPRRLPFSLIGCVLAATAYPCVGGLPFLGCLLAGVGNACFHVGGGVTVMRTYAGRVAPLGVFVSPGALGVFLAVFFAGKRLSCVWLFPFFMIVCAAVLLLFVRREQKECGGAAAVRGSFGDLEGIALAALMMLFLAVCLRSYFGLLPAYSWKVGFALPFLFICGVAAGKACGGFLGDRIGLFRAALLSLSVSALFFLFAPAHPLCGIAAICCFNMTMPLTLFAVAEICGEAKGFAFGLTTFALFLGTLPTLLPSFTKSGDPGILVPFVLLSIILVCGGVALMERIGRKER